MDELGRDGVRDHGAARRVDGVVVDAFGMDGETFGEVGRIGAFDFEEDNLLVRGNTMLGAEQVVEALEVFRCERPGVSGNEANRLTADRVEDCGRFGGEFDAGDSQFGGGRSLARRRRRGG